jgi:Peptidase A4 family
MRRSWCIPVMALAVAGGTLLATSAAEASSAPPTPGHVQPGGLVTGLTTPFAAHNGTNRTATSTNWSGYAVTGSGLKSVSARWVEPTGHCSSSGTQYSSFWVGLDGYNSNSVEQTGSSLDCHGHTPKYYAWYEMFPAYPVNFSNKVKPGDHFSASVVYQGSGKFVMKITDSTEHWSHSITKSSKTAKRSSAEVIVEAPSSSTGVLPLADFGKVRVTSSKVNGSAIGSHNAIKITMKSGGTTKDTVTSLSHGTNFSATWKHR